MSDELRRDIVKSRTVVLSVVVLLVFSTMAVGGLVGGTLSSKESKAPKMDATTTEEVQKRTIGVAGANGSEINATFNCTQVTVEAAAYDAVLLSLLDGTDRRFTGPFRGTETFSETDDRDGNGNDEITRSITIVVDGERFTAENPMFEQCVGRQESEERQGGGEQTPTPEGESTG